MYNPKRYVQANVTWFNSSGILPNKTWLVLSVKCRSFLPNRNVMTIPNTSHPLLFSNTPTFLPSQHVKADGNG